MDNTPKDEGVDFSGYFKKSESEINNPASNPITVTPKRPMRTTYLLVGILITLAVVQVIVFLIRRQDSGGGIPEGYQIIYPTNGPGRVEKIK